jgi:hypothetical protein
VSHFADPWNPQPEEVRAWAYEPDAEEPTQDFDLALRWARHERAYFDLASDPACPARLYFLSVLYLIVGDTVRNGFAEDPEPVVRGFIDRGGEYDHADIRTWQERSRELLADPASFDHEAWCAGGFARRGAT